MVMLSWMYILIFCIIWLGEGLRAVMIAAGQKGRYYGCLLSLVGVLLGPLALAGVHFIPEASQPPTYSMPAASSEAMRNRRNSYTVHAAQTEEIFLLVLWIFFLIFELFIRSGERDSFFTAMVVVGAIAAIGGGLASRQYERIIFRLTPEGIEVPANRTPMFQRQNKKFTALAPQVYAWSDIRSVEAQYISAPPVGGDNKTYLCVRIKPEARERYGLAPDVEQQEKKVLPESPLRGREAFLNEYDLVYDEQHLSTKVSYLLSKIEEIQPKPDPAETRATAEK
ncbi:MAG: hypothetical protein H6642_11540 [Caldilineaceae bacterium]|nr:hypothetical protein [Caldilineaceae bacterium]